MAANPTIQLGTDGNWAIKEDNLLAYKKDGDRFFNKEFDFTRGSVATYVDKDGLIETVGVDEPRIDFLNNTKGHLLLEPSRQNIITYSEFDSASPTNWQTGFGTGTFSYDLVSYKSRPALKQRQQTEGRSHKQQNVTVSTSTTYTLSFYIDKENSINIDDNDRVCSIITSDNIGFTSKNYGDADENNRINFTFTTNTDTSIQIRIGLGSAGNVQGDKTLIFSMPQLEQGSYATSYIPTQGSTVTRSAESCYQDNLLTDIINASYPFTMYAEAKAVLDSTQDYLTFGNRNVSNLYFALVLNSDGTVFFAARANGVVESINSSATAITNGNFFKAAVTMESATSGKISVNGVLDSKTNFTQQAINSNINDLLVGMLRTVSDTGRRMPIKDVKLYNTALTDAELIALTS